MKIALTGATGFVGFAILKESWKNWLWQFLTKPKHQIIRESVLP